MDWYFVIVVVHCFMVFVSCKAIQQEGSPCQDSIGVQTGFLETRDIKTSTSQKDFSATDPWCATKQDDQQYMALDLGEDFKISKISTLGKADDKNRYVTKYALEFSNDGTKWEEYKDKAGKKEFIGNDNTFAVKSNELKPSIQARYVKLKPLQWSAGGICTSMDLFGCSVEELNKSKKS